MLVVVPIPKAPVSVVPRVEVPLTKRVPLDAREDVAVSDPARDVPWSVVEARDADEVAVRVPMVPL